MPPIFAGQGLTNPAPVRRIMRAANVRRVDIAGINNSEGAFGGHGFDHATQRIIERNAGFYGTGIFSAMQSDGSSAGSGDGYGLTGAANRAQPTISAGVVSGRRPTLGSAPAELLANFNQTNTPNTAGGSIGYAPLEALFIPSGATETGFTGISLGGSNPVIPFVEAFTYHVWRGEFGASGGSGTMQPYVRRDESPFTNLGNATVQPSNSGTLGNMVRVDLNIAADAARSSWGAIACYICNGGGGRNITGPAFATFQRVTRTNRAHGFARSAIYSAGSRTALSMWHWATLMPDTSWAHLLDALCGVQNQALADQMLIVELDEGTNQTGESRFGTGAPNQSTADAPENFAFYMRGVTAHIRARWAATGRNPNNLAFIVSCSHSTNAGNDAELVTYRTALLGAMDFAGVDKDTLVVDREANRPKTLMTADSDFADTVHLTQLGYERCQAALYHAILHEPQRKTIPQKSDATLYVWDRSNPAYNWPGHPSVAQIVRPDPLIGTTDTAAQAAAKIIAGIVPGAASGSNARRWALFAQNLVNARFGPMGPQSKGLDPITSSTVTPPEASLFVSNGIPATIAWVREVMLLVRAELRTRGLPDPAWYFDDDEEVPGFGTSPWVTAPLVGTGGLWNPSVAATQAGEPSAAVVPFMRMGLLEAARSADGITYNNALTEFDNANKGLHNYLRRYNRLGFIKHLCVFQVLREIFPEIQVLAYDECAALHTNPVTQPIAGWATQSSDNIYGDVHSPWLYPANPNDPTHAAQIASLGAQTYYRNWCIDMRQRIKDGPLGSIRCAPWLFVPSEEVTWPGASGPSYVPTVQDQFYVIRELFNRFGDREFLLWSASMDATKSRLVDELASLVVTLGEGVRSKRLGVR